MKWTKWLHSILAFIVTEVEPKCGSFSPNSKLQEISPLIIESKLGQTVTIKIPEPEIRNNVVSVLTFPNGDHYNLDRLNTVNTFKVSLSYDVDNQIDETQYLKKNEDTSKIAYNVTLEYDEEMTNIILGPITEDYFGNWVISSCYVDELGIDTEMFQVVSVHIEEQIDTVPKGSIAVMAHRDLRVRLERAIPGLRSCELAGPPAAADRVYHRDPEYPSECGFLLRDVSARDSGAWRVVAVGRVVHVGTLDVIVLD